MSIEPMTREVALLHVESAHLERLFAEATTEPERQRIREAVGELDARLRAAMRRAQS